MAGILEDGPLASAVSFAGKIFWQILQTFHAHGREIVEPAVVVLVCWREDQMTQPPDPG